MESDGNSSPVPVMTATEESTGKKATSGAPGFLSNLSLEPMMLTHMIGLTLQVVTLQDFYLERVCRITLKFPAETCANLTKNKTLGNNSYCYVMT